MRCFFAARKVYILEQKMFKITRILVKCNLRNTRALIHTIETKELKLTEYGNPETSVEISTGQLTSNLKPDELLVKLKCAPINPADINIIQGKYGMLPDTLPANIGNEGLFQVVQTHPDNKKFQVGDLVVPAWKLGWGTWRSHSVENERLFYKIVSNETNKLHEHALAMVTVNPPTAYRLLKDFVDLKPGDTVIQNGANSGVGQSVIQLAKIFKINLVNIIRKRENQDEVHSFLKSAEYVFFEEDLRKSVDLSRELWKKIAKPRLALNCVGGKATTDMMRLLDKNSTMVTYGGMSKQPVTVNTADFIFKNLKCCGFWLTEWKKNHPEEYQKMLDYIVQLITGNQLKPPKCEEFRLEDFREAFKRVQTPFVGSKILFVGE